MKFGTTFKKASTIIPHLFTQGPLASFEQNLTFLTYLKHAPVQCTMKGNLHCFLFLHVFQPYLAMHWSSIFASVHFCTISANTKASSPPPNHHKPARWTEYEATTCIKTCVAEIALMVGEAIKASAHPRCSTSQVYQGVVIQDVNTSDRGPRGLDIRSSCRS